MLFKQFLLAALFTVGSVTANPVADGNSVEVEARDVNGVEARDVELDARDLPAVIEARDVGDFDLEARDLGEFDLEARDVGDDDDGLVARDGQSHRRRRCRRRGFRWHHGHHRCCRRHGRRYRCY